MTEIVADYEVKKSRLPSCEVCKKYDSIYTCPKCEVKTCCLDCVKIHKKELECDGIRDRTKFVSIKEYSNSDFYSDYVFLEECSRFVYGKQRNVAKRYTQIDKPLPHYLNRLKRAARERGTALLILPEHFACRKSNNSRVRGREILWRVDWLFGDLLLPSSGPPVSENTRLGEMLQRILDLEVEPRIACYKAAGVSNLRLFLKAERVKGSSGKYYELDAGRTIAENLRGKCLLEYPTVQVLLRDHAYALDVLHSDDESDREEMMVPETAPETAPSPAPSKKPRRELTTERVARQEREKDRREAQRQRKSGPKNLLFVTGYSDEDSESDVES